MANLVASAPTVEPHDRDYVLMQDSDNALRRYDLRYRQGLLDGVAFKHTAYALDRDSRKAALAHFLQSATADEQEEAPLAA